ncbi:VUT family protein [Hyphomonas sp. FCG-A18]|uniref:hypothetical protein n=1 Tax=Hyphomonas sp. FCG-A18 TaxID=3080019 RepID=UPI002B2AA31F|nr:VUT family protein [Hyphomonas sp. FCG-A18]
MDIIETFVAILTNNRPSFLIPVVLGLALTLAILWRLGGRLWAVIYVMMIPFLNWSFGVVPNLEFVGPWVSGEHSLFGLVFPDDTQVAGSLMLHPLTLVTGLVFVIRDFVQREMHQWVLLAMALALGWSMYYAWIVIVIASGLAFFVSEFFDWLLFTFTKMKLSKRILYSSAVATPIDTTIFLYGADLAKQIEFGSDPGNTLTLANWIVFVIGKMIGAVIVSDMVRRREDAGLTNPYENQPAQSATI